MAANHFYDIQEAAALKISKIADKGDNYAYEDVVWHAWEKIPRPYFPERGATATAPRYSIEREAYRGSARDPPEHKPDVIVVRIHNVQQAAGQRPTAIERDILWIECKAPTHLKPHGWHNVLGEAVTRLNAAHPDREVFLILAIGMKWMPFMWDPFNPFPRGQGLKMLKDNGQPWDDEIDGRIRPVNMPNQRHVNGRIIDTTRAFTLNYWDADANGNIIHLAELQLLEALFNNIQGRIFNGANPANF
ncbi:hypothetical protein MYCTH_2309625 [Thermothelomyces thermophilus ATCC 42464]|uniref:Fungal-type protein kinase domain-containing protein n=1 Tax=Thermothelomyces thermophilus (strain ATCC 42464 / BCRC 31852 / DSM 1799) TaxID=573729 RepID=G2QJ08_THET4|nr:uncharacterized protein MYCTH_2309625 [Thermothelomyces thermophilus ATCC 42464]AEO60427.1 hypothetical protein MYCTH_2309625 [Thermothelomyces thermophilus ATCC 42464]